MLNFGKSLAISSKFICYSSSIICMWVSFSHSACMCVCVSVSIRKYKWFVFFFVLYLHRISVEQVCVERFTQFKSLTRCHYENTLTANYAIVLFFSSFAEYSIGSSLIYCEWICTVVKWSNRIKVLENSFAMINFHCHSIFNVYYIHCWHFWLNKDWPFKLIFRPLFLLFAFNLFFQWHSLIWLESKLQNGISFCLS